MRGVASSGGMLVSAVVVAGLDMWACRWRCAPWRPGTRWPAITSTRSVKRLEAGSFVEDVSACEPAAALESGRFRPSADADACDGFDVAVITVPTPLRDGLPDLACVEAASRTLARYLRRARR